MNKIKIKVMVDHPEVGYIEVPQDHDNPLFASIDQVDAIVGTTKPGCFGVPDICCIKRVNLGGYGDDQFVFVFVDWHPNFTKCFPPSMLVEEKPAEPQKIQVQESEAIEPQVPIEEIPY